MYDSSDRSVAHVVSVVMHVATFQKIGVPVVVEAPICSPIRVSKPCTRKQGVKGEQRARRRCVGVWGGSDSGGQGPEGGRIGGAGAHHILLPFLVLIC